MKVLMVSGSIPPEPCGVGDYTYYLTGILNTKGVSVSLLKLNFLSLLKLLRVDKDVLIHIQYPSRGFGISLLPQFVTLFKMPVVTLHEFSQVHLLRKISEIPFLIFSRRIIVTTEHEREAIIKLYSGFNKKICVIPVSAAFNPVGEVRSFKHRSGIAFFGLMRPNKGIEEFLGLVEELRYRKLDIPVRVFSAIPVGSEKYFEGIKSSADGLDIEWYLNKPLKDVSSGLLRSKYSYLHFSDGVSDRRSSFMAAISHGLLTISNSGPMTPVILKNAFIDAQTPQQAIEELILLESNHEKSDKLQQDAMKASKAYSPERITELHIKLYKGVWHEA
uniref:Uncharacterized protein n=1 Tax=Hydrogenovibrio crunogenus (strain DSM 25203 / XCL-2) TaxID=317025 RepID=Q31EZ9_HYDCU